MKKRQLSKVLTGLALALCSASLMASDFKVTLLGTGVPNPRPERFSQSTLIEAGSQKLMDGLQMAYEDDIKIRLEDEKNPPEGIAVEAYEFSTPGVIYEKDGVKVTSFEVDHGDVIKPELLETSAAFQRIFAHHVSPEQAGTVFTEAKPKMAVYSHIARYDSADISAPTDAEIIAETRKTYDGTLVVGVDLMQFDIGKEGISISVLPASK